MKPHSNLENIKFFKINEDSQFSIDFTIRKEFKKSIILLHGLNDYHYNHELHNLLFSLEYNIYAITLRNFGQNILDKTKYFYLEDSNLCLYYYEIDKTIEFINSEKINFLAHSFGGLIATMYCYEGKYKDKINKLVLNSPFFKFHNPFKILESIESLIIPFGEIVKFISPRGGFGKLNIPKLNKEKTEYEMTWQGFVDIKNNGFKINPVDLCKDTPWMIDEHSYYFLSIKACYEKQLLIQYGKIKIDKKVLILTTNTDYVLASSDIINCSELIFNNYEIFQYSKGYHNVFSSKLDIRNVFFDKLKLFLK